MLHRGGANYTTNICKEIIINKNEYKRISEVVIPKLLAEVYKLLEK